MSKNIALAINHMYPDLVPFKDFRVVEENGIQSIADWTSLVSKPTDAELNSAWQSFLTANQAIALEEARSQKQTELKDACDSALANGYFYTVGGINYRFSFDVEAQANFMGALRLLEAGKVATVPWTAYKNGTDRTRIDLTLDDLHGMELAQFNHKNTITGKYNNLLINYLYPASTIPAVNAITWG